MSERQFTGRHALMLFVGFFGIIFAMNGVMAYMALSTFPGLEARNGYIASQTFDARRKAQEALGWTVDADEAAGVLSLAFTDRDGNPVRVATLRATVGRPTEIKDDFSPDFIFDGAAYTAPVDLAPGKWDVRLKATAEDGTLFSQRIQIHVVR